MIRPALTLLAVLAAVPAAAAERRFDASGFDKVALGGSDDVVVRQGSAFSVVAVGDADELDRLEITVKDGTLNIGRKKGNWSWSSKDVAVTVTLPALRGLALAGSGDIQADKGASDVFGMRLAGSGRLTLAALDAKTANIAISGSGTVKSAGRCGALNLRVAGSGVAELAGLRCTNASISVAGSGDVSAHVAGEAAVRVAGSGDVTIAGGARCTKKIAGSGNVVCS